MEFIPYTKEEAEEICEDFEDLIDTEYHTGASVLMIDAVTLAPVEDADKQTFLDNFYRTKNISEALAFYDETLYDVLLLVSDADNEASYSYIDIRTYITDNAVVYNFPA